MYCICLKNNQVQTRYVIWSRDVCFQYMWSSASACENIRNSGHCIKWISRTQANTKLLQKLYTDFSGHILLHYSWDHSYDFKTDSKDITKLKGPPLFQLI